MTLLSADGLSASVPRRASAALAARSRRRRRHLSILLTALLALLAASLWRPAEAARAEELPPFVSLFLKEAEAEMDAKIAWGRARQADNGDFLLEEVSWATKLEDAKRGVSYETVAVTALIRFSGLKADGDLLRATRVVFSDTRLDISEKAMDEDAPEDGLKARIPEVTFEDVSILKPAAARSRVEKLYAGRMVAARMLIPEIVAVAPLDLKFRDITFTFDGDRRTYAGRSTFTIARIELPAKAADLLRRDDALGQLGYDKLVFEIGSAWTSRWDEKERIHADLMLRIGMHQAGRLGLELGDLTVPFEIVELVSDPKKADELERRFTSGDETLMNQLKNDVTLRALRLFWEDEGLTRKLIAMEARRKGISAEDVINAWVAAPQAFLFMLGLPEVGNQASEALKTFLKDPKRLDISMQAKAPMNFLTLMTLLEDPKSLVEALGLKITANTPPAEGGTAQ